MPTINSIIPGYHTAVIGTAQAVGQSNIPRPPPDTSGVKDVFERSQGNKKPAPSSAADSGSGLNGRAARAYELQAGAGRAPETAGQQTSSQPTVNTGEPELSRTPATQLNAGAMSTEEALVLMKLKRSDAAVRAHENAHLAAAGSYARGAASFTYRRGPDGRNYAVGGEVQIDMSSEATPERTIAKMRQVRAAALAPANPSPQDRKVASAASAAIAEATRELQAEKMAEIKISQAANMSKKNPAAPKPPEGAVSSPFNQYTGPVSLKGTGDSLNLFI